MQPLRFHPIMKRAVWGGRRLGLEYGKPVGDELDYGESWEVSDLPGRVSVVDGGEFDGVSLAQLMALHRAEIMGRHRRYDRFPLLMKFLDANRPLSVQVHPGSHLGSTMEPKDPSKAELWVVLEADLGNQISVGLKPKVGRQELEQAVQKGTVPECLNTFEAQRGDCFFLPPGTVHSLGQGVVIAEVQQACDVTYRLDDWGRIGIHGKPRELHIDQALATIDYNLGPVSPLTPQIDSDEPSVQSLVNNQYFAANRYLGRSTIAIPNDNTPHVLTLLSGGAVVVGDNEIEMKRGDALLVPAERASTTLELDESAIFLDAFLGRDAG